MIYIKILKYLLHPSYFLLYLDLKNYIKLNDKLYLSINYKKTTNKKMNWIKPATFNEKLQWLKLYDRKEIYTKMVDKYEVKKYVARIIGDEYIIPTIGVYEKFDDIDFGKLPNQFVIKCTHDSGGLVIVKDKKKINIKEAKKKINNSLKQNFYYVGREWPYKNVMPRIIIEKYMSTKSEELIDYKFFCFNGIPKITLVCSERFSSENMCETWFDDKWNLLPIVENNHRVDRTLKKPKTFEKMKELAACLSKEIPFVRIDFYEIKGKIYFGEITFFPASGYERFEPEKWNRIMGDWIELPTDKK